MPTSDPPNRDDNERLARLRLLGVLDSDAEPLFDALAKAAALVAGTPIALLSLADEDRHWFKASVGFDEAREVSHEHAFCTHAMLGHDILEIPDTLLDPKFCNNVLVCGEPNVRFYAGAPIMLDGMNLGTVCVIDRIPRMLDATQKATLVELANAAAHALQQRAEARERAATHSRALEVARQRDEEHAQLSHIIQATRAGIWEWDLESGLAKVDARWADQIGYQLDELPVLNGELWRAHTHREDYESAYAGMTAHIRGETGFYYAEFRMRHKDGRWIWIRSLGGVISRDDRGKALLIAGTHVDVSERKADERQQRDSEAFLDRTGRVAEVGGWQVDVASGAVTWSRETCRLHNVPEGYRPSIQEALDFYPEAASLRVRMAIDKAMADGTEWDVEVPFIPRGGAQRWVRVVGLSEYENGIATRLVGAIQDITSRRRALVAVEVSERRFRRLFEQSTGLIYTHDLDGTILSVNPAAARALGYSVLDMIGKPLTAFVPRNEHAMVERYLHRILDAESVADLMPFRAVDGTHRVWQFTSVIDDEQGKPYVLCHALDVTESKRHERQLRDWSIRDPLTGCFNRRYLAEVMANVQANEPWGCVVVDLDDFKQINDTHGHQRGDEVLIEVATFLCAHVRADDVVVRAGGDEFLILLKGAGETHTKAICDRMLADGDQLPVRFSLGSAVRTQSEPLTESLRVADERLYAARAQTR
ncbi:MAG: PAS domain S-box protein [Dokdonella sp.]